MTSINHSGPSGLNKILVFLVFFLLESMVFAIITLSPYLPKTGLLYYHVGLTTALLVVALVMRGNDRVKPYWPLFYAFFVAGAAIFISSLFSDDLLRTFGVTIATPKGIALAKFSESILIVITILVLMPVMGFNLRSMYLQQGKVRIWLPVAIAALIVIPLFAYFSLSSSQSGVLDKLLPLWPWISLFVISNGFMEELLYRGIFLQKYESFLGKAWSNILTAIVFAIMHTQVTYAAQMVQFLVIVLVLALIWGFLMQKSESLWGAALFHAASDCLIIFGVFASM